MQGQTGVLAREADYAGTGIILRGAAAGARVLQLLAQGVPPPAGTWPGGSAGAVPLFVDTSSQNLGVSITEGIDLQAAYRWMTNSLGSFTFTANGSYLTKYEVAMTSIATPSDRLNKIFNPLRLKGRVGVAWQEGPYRAGATLTYVNGYQNTIVAPFSRISEYTPVDLTFGYDMGSLGWNVVRGPAARSRSPQCVRRGAAVREYRAEQQRQWRLRCHGHQSGRPAVRGEPAEEVVALQAARAALLRYRSARSARSGPRGHCGCARASPLGVGGAAFHDGGRDHAVIRIRRCDALGGVERGEQQAIDGHGEALEELGDDSHCPSPSMIR